MYTFSCSLLCALACSVLKGYTIQHLPDGTVMVESIVIKVSSSAEEPNTKVLLLSWSYQVIKAHLELHLLIHPPSIYPSVCRSVSLTAYVSS